MDWSREDVFTLRMSSFWGDTAEEVAHLLSRDVADVMQKAADLGIRLKRFQPAQLRRAGLYDRRR
jgi:hypothetical protein